MWCVRCSHCCLACDPLSHGSSFRFVSSSWESTRLISKRHKYLYPFLIITIVQQLVCMMMATIILIFSFISFDTMRQIIGHSLDFDTPPSTNMALAVIGGTVAVCVVLSFVHIWQAVIIYR
ncbi:hypothetical protein OSTOST_25545 [Ostertagia ostertagi]